MNKLNIDSADVASPKLKFLILIYLLSMDKKVKWAKLIILHQNQQL